MNYNTNIYFQYLYCSFLILYRDWLFHSNWSLIPMGLIDHYDEPDHLKVLVIRYQLKHLYKSLLSYPVLINWEHRLAELNVTLEKSIQYVE